MLQETYDKDFTMKITYNKFRQIFWMVIALISVILFFAYIMTNLYFYKTKFVGEGEIITRTNKITGKKTYKVLTKDIETKWATLKDHLKKEEMEK